MKRLVAALLLASCSNFAPVSGSAVPETAKKYSVFFSPKGGCTQAVVDLIGSAKSEVLVQAYSFTSKPIAAALVAKSKSGVTVEVIADSSDVGTPGLALLTGATGMVPTWIDSKHAIAHNKILIADRKIIETGSFNYTLQAETSNAENCLIIHDAALAKAYVDNWQAHLAHSVPVQEPTP